MLDRLVSFILIAAVFVCPMRCVKGICCAGQEAPASCEALNCCQESPSLETTCPQHGVADCCRHQSSNKSQQHPGRCPGKSTCQGVCGGAVFEKPCEFKGVQTAALGALIDSDFALGTFFGQLRVAEFADHRGLSVAGNYGRSLRTLHASYLC